MTVLTPFSNATMPGVPPEPVVLILPGWLGSGAEHWQMHWARLHGYAVVEQNDWLNPLRGDWMARLDEQGHLMMEVQS